MRLFVLLSLCLGFALGEPELKPSGLKVEYIFKPDSCDKTAQNGKILAMHYTGTLENGKKFDSSHDRNEAFKFQLGVGQVIRGWDEGILGMCTGEKRRLIVPSELGYGQQGAGDVIPPDATLYFDIELVDVEDGPPPVNVFKQIDIDTDNQISRDELSNYLQKQVEEMRLQGGDAEQAEQMLQDQDKMVEEIFSHEDRDRDGYISHVEFSGPKHDEL